MRDESSCIESTIKWIRKEEWSKHVFDERNNAIGTFVCDTVALEPESLKITALLLFGWFIKIIYFWYVEPTQNKQHTFPSSSPFLPRWWSSSAAPFAYSSCSHGDAPHQSRRKHHHLLDRFDANVWREDGKSERRRDWREKSSKRHRRIICLLARKRLAHSFIRSSRSFPPPEVILSFRIYYPFVRRYSNFIEKLRTICAKNVEFFVTSLARLLKWLCHQRWRWRWRRQCQTYNVAVSSVSRSRRRPIHSVHRTTLAWTVLPSVYTAVDRKATVYFRKRFLRRANRKIGFGDTKSRQIAGTHTEGSSSSSKQGATKRITLV